MAKRDSMFDAITRIIEDNHIIENIKSRESVVKANTERINNYIAEHHCNIINYMPIELMKAVIGDQYNDWKLSFGLKLFYKGQLYDVSKSMDYSIKEAIISDIIYATTVKMIPVDYLEAYVNHSYGGV